MFAGETCDIVDVKGRDGLSEFFILDRFSGIHRIRFVSTSGSVSGISLDPSFNLTV